MKKIIGLSFLAALGTLVTLSANAQLASESPALSDAQVKKIMTVKKQEPAKVQVASQQPASKVPATESKQTEVKNTIPPVSDQGGVVPAGQVPASEKQPLKNTDPVEPKSKSTK